VYTECHASWSKIKLAAAFSERVSY